MKKCPLRNTNNCQFHRINEVPNAIHAIADCFIFECERKHMLQIHYDYYSRTYNYCSKCGTKLKLIGECVGKPPELIE